MQFCVIWQVTRVLSTCPGGWYMWYMCHLSIQTGSTMCHTCLSNWILYYGHLNVVSFHMFILAMKGVSRWHFHAWYELCVSSFSFLTSTCEHFLSLSQADWAIHTTFIIFTWPQVIAENWMINKGDIQSFHKSLLCFQAMMQWGILDHSLKVWQWPAA